MGQRTLHKILIRKNHETPGRTVAFVSLIRGFFFLHTYIKHTDCSTAYRKQKCRIIPCVSFSKRYIKRKSASNVLYPTTGDLILVRADASYNDLVNK